MSRPQSNFSPTRRTSRRTALKTLAAGGIATVASSVARGAPAEAPAKLVASARPLGELFRGNLFDITGQDAATSLVLPSGNALWVFGDTVEGPFESIRELDLADKLSNTAAIVPPQDASAGLPRFEFLAAPDGKRPRQIVPFGADEDPGQTRVWPMHGLCTAKGVYLYYHRISLKPGVDVFDDFVLDGMGLARANPDEFNFQRLAAPDGSQLFWKGDQPGFGVFVVRRDDYAYLWGSLMTGMFLARTRPDAVEQLSSYEYLVEAPTRERPTVRPRWSKTFAPTAVLFDGVPNEMSASFNKHLGCFVAIHTRLRANEIAIRTAPDLVGPWSEAEIAFRPPRLSGGDLFYAAKEHPELARDGGKRIYVSFVNSATYVPQLVELTLA
ncbi:MAG: DUF4185 domain-containing protein [Planctomycetales bacterium]|nr:DUF4185 domain-containing protein [Planctomycetales bacterium]